MADDAPEIDLEALDTYLLSDLAPDDCMLLSDLMASRPGSWSARNSYERMDVGNLGRRNRNSSLNSRCEPSSARSSGRFNEIAAIMETDPDSFDPIFDQWPNGDLIVTDWAAGFFDAIRLRRKAWEPIFRHHRAKMLVEPLIILGDDEDFFGRATHEGERRFSASKPEAIPTCVLGIHDFWRDWQSRQRPHPRRQRERLPKG